MGSGVKEERGLIFLHIPKAAGTTLRTVIARQFPRQVVYSFYGPTQRVSLFCELPERRRAEFRVLQGHMPFGLHQYLSVPADYITLLREPVERIISFYYWALRTRDETIYPLMEGMSLRDFADSGLWLTVNQQTRLLSGRMGEPTAETLEAAKENLASRFTAFGLDEKFDESLMLFKRRLGWRNIFYARQNVTKDRPRRRDVPDSTIDLIRRHNALDLELYAFAKRRFDEVISEQGQPFADAVRSFRRVNKVYGKLSEGCDALRRAAPPQLKRLVRRGMRALRPDAPR